MGETTAPCRRARGGLTMQQSTERLEYEVKGSGDPLGSAGDGRRVRATHDRAVGWRTTSSSLPQEGLGRSHSPRPRRARRGTIRDRRSSGDLGVSCAHVAGHSSAGACGAAGLVSRNGPHSDAADCHSAGASVEAFLTRWPGVRGYGTVTTKRAGHLLERVGGTTGQRPPCS